MKGRINSFRILSFACILIYAFVLFQIFAKNLVVDSDYPFHMHNIWAVSNGYIVHSPFLSGGAHLTLRYGGPIILLGGAIYPFFGKFTAAILLAAAVPPFWYSARKVFEHFSNTNTAKIAALVAILNPFTLYYLSCLLPFIWGVAFALGSIYFYLKERTSLAILLGSMAVVTHPLAIFLPFALLLTNQNFKQWLKIFSTPLLISAIQITTFWGIPSSGGNQFFLPNIALVNIAILTSVLVTAFWAMKETRFLSGLALIFLTSWCIGGIFGLWVPTLYFNRIGFLVFLMLIPFLIQKAKTLPIAKFPIGIPILALLTVGGVYAGPLTTPYDNASVYRDLPDDTLTILREGTVHLSSKCSAIYELPMENVHFSNTGQGGWDPPYENAETYAERIEEENASYILLFGESPEEEYILDLGYDLIYFADNLKIYKTI